MPQLGGSREPFRCRRASVAVAVTTAAQVDEPQPGGSREPSRKRKAIVAAVIITAQVDEPWPGGSKEPSQKRRRASTLNDEGQQKGQGMSTSPVFQSREFSQVKQFSLCFYNNMFLKMFFMEVSKNFGC